MGDRLVVALVRGVHGLHGDVRLEVLTDRPEERFAPGSVLYPEGAEAPLTVTAATAIPDGPGWRVRFGEVRDRTTADDLRGLYLEALIEAEEDLAAGSFYWHELIGVAVTDPDGTELGRIHDVYEVGETEAVVVRGGPAGEFDVPLVRALVQAFDPRAGRFVVDPSLLDLKIPSAEGGPARPRAPRRRSGPRGRRPEAESAGPEAESPGNGPVEASDRAGAASPETP